MDPIVSSYLLRLEFGELKIFNNMAIIPLFTLIDEGQSSHPKRMSSQTLRNDGEKILLNADRDIEYIKSKGYREI
jgi:hypothetical protein